MTRNCLLLLVASATLALAGCAHCDTCDDFPTPCQGGDCGGGMGGPAPSMGLPGMGPMFPPPTAGPDAPATAPATPPSGRSPALGSDLGPAPTLPAAPETPPQMGAPKM